MFNTNNTTITNNFSSSEDKIIEQRRFMYQKAIEAYQYHVNRYHTWMNYYALFNGALFVGFCSLTTATTEINEKSCNSAINQCCYMEESCKIYALTNDYFPLIVILCILGIVSSICWFMSLLGHERWEDNWMKNIEYYEDDNDDNNDVEKFKSFILYKIINGDKKDFKAFSTHAITKIFIICVGLGWLFYLIMTMFKKYNCACYFIILFSIIIVMIVMFKYKSLYSDITSKVSRINKSKIS